ncbi:MAG TPA: hypothetical protein VMW56_21120 [Candidatus Margulisiibacteriota bacterium]|nr:hypothetical protein [Candidatus Margulisiibacteriota bacterium]
MRTRNLNRSHRGLVAGILLAAFAFRAIVPVGFMPASGHPFALEFCRDQDPTQLARHHSHSHSGTHSHFDRCPFGSAPAAGPVSQIAGVVPTTPPAATEVFHFDDLRLGVRPDRAHRSRAPPSLA